MAKSADEVMAQLEADPEYQARRAALDAEHERLVARIREESRPVARDLAQVGFDVEFVADLYEGAQNYTAAVPVLLRWLPRLESQEVKEELVRALSIQYARPVAGPPLVDELRKLLQIRGPGAENPSQTASSDMPWVIANALDVVADDSVLDDLLDLVGDSRLDVSTRATLLRALGNMADPRAADRVMDLLQDSGDDDVPLLIGGVVALGRMRAVAARDLLHSYADHRDRELRREAQRALKAIDRPPRRPDRRRNV
jgi:hypothetical protein